MCHTSTWAHASWKPRRRWGTGNEQNTGDGSGLAGTPGTTPCGPETGCGLSGPQDPPGDPGPMPSSAQAPLAAHPGQGQRVGGIEALPPVDAVLVRRVQNRQWDAHPGGGAVGREGVAWAPPGSSGATAPDPAGGPEAGGPQAWLLSSVAAAPLTASSCPTCSDHSPDLCGLRQGLGAPLVPGCSAQAAGGARIRRYQKEAPVDTVTVHACGAMRSGSSLRPGARIPGPPRRPNHTGSRRPRCHWPHAQAYRCTRAEHVHAPALT